MFEQETVLILGAGASKPYGFPLAKELNNLICDWIGPDRQVESSPKELLEIFPTSTFRKLARALKKLEDLPIDLFLAQNSDFVNVGKYCIAHFIAESENESKLYKHWYANLFQALLPNDYEKHPIEVLRENKLAIITFNYDRSLEQCLMKNAQAFWPEKEKCASAISDISVIHVHGQLGRLPWQEAKGFLRHVAEREYSPDFGEEYLPSIGGIKLVSETDKESPEFIEARQHLKRAKEIYFLGFGYHPQNLERLKFETEESKKPFVKGTYVGLKKGNRLNKLKNSGAEFGIPIQFDGNSLDIDGFFETVI